MLIRFFPYDYSDFPALYTLMGQYVFYDVTLRLQKSPLRLYIALPEKDYKRLTSNHILNAAFQDANMRFMPVNLQTGEIQQIDTLVEIVKNAVFYYAGGGLNVETFALANDAQKTYAVIITDVPVQERSPSIVVIARISRDTVIIDADTTDKPLVDRLIENGVSREKIILAYAGEPVTVEAGQ